MSGHATFLKRFFRINEHCFHPDPSCNISTASTSNVDGVGKLVAWRQQMPVAKNTALYADLNPTGGYNGNYGTGEQVLQEKRAPPSQNPVRDRVASVQVTDFAKRRRKQSGRGQFECQWCGADFTAKHNLKRKTLIFFVFCVSFTLRLALRSH
ncbi:uncharacterized protein LACBIDRAFT_324600 [Laccaria bicolor S238N-H82]|uniref:Predicted protein n=1 Tax=Laccaria bicolor (strain S238N-H82 / ATCC MYA-4686) TaxID=486041 RepID=B0D2F5_LACBS|nr:uncharacterized protein LACBIDRAFT_324600 [Laccaria bicolor S238N-H82]EDR11091.1 predicted protein [Laccaria bicolor S238N-H82]|eukprot:XP_001878392.1 predicted protein [Laccaria bicolor S238N-H82]